jgi:DNA topoisomerase II|uniref:DNA topoisomerase (ATP-hydrolyzing) n=1 Tax=viral metagenome TaxID=1070528 RepID=A0A6C0JRA6_9ZZZZ
MSSTAKKVETKYKKYELLEHIQSLPDTYIGSTELTKIRTYIYSSETKKMVEKEITYIPGLLKIFDEVIVNAIDHSMRLKSESKENIKHVKNIKISIDKDSGEISVFNDGNGIDIEKHSEYNDIWIPELIFGELLTSTNYDKTQEKTWGGKNGFGAKLTNIFSKEFIIETVDHYTKKIYTQKFSNNMRDRNKPTIKSSQKQPYTQITFKPDYERFGLTDGMTDDIYDLFMRRVIDACATTNKDVSVFFNNEKLMIKDFEKYAELFVEKTEQPLVYEVCNDRWEIVATLSKTGIHEQISFVNGINTIRGGRHVDYVTQNIIKRLVDLVQSKKKKTIKAQHIKDNLIIFVKSIIVNPSFDSQSKETLTTQTSKFGSKCELSDKFIDKLYKSGIVDKALSLTEFHEQKKLVKTDGKKTSKLIIPKLDDANNAGTKNSSNCTLILTEGDSAKTMAISGLSVIGRDNYGVFPLRGKVMNVKDASLQKISDNAEITALKKILGLEQNKKYSDVSSLRYGSIMIMTDQDHDGSHIKGLLFNVFQSLWNTLYKIDGFMTSMLTPIIKATNTRTKEVIPFYNMSDYEKWNKSNSTGNWKIKYYKGLGTSSDEEAKEYFRNMKKITYTHSDNSDEKIDLAFNKKRSDDRKTWLINYDKNDVLDYTKDKVNYDTFINKEFIHYSNRDLERSINHLCDGLKESTRKILYACFKRKLYTNEIKVAQLAGNVSEVTAYHHGENSLQQAIIGMAQIYVGTNNINLLSPNGQFGSRIQGGSDASSPRYIYTLISQLTKLIFKEEDNCILNYLNEDGQVIEPDYYIPIIPMILVNGGVGIGTGFSTNVPLFNPSNIIDSCLNICSEIESNKVIVKCEDDLFKIYSIIDNLVINDFTPYYLGFNGKIEKNEKGLYESRGVYNWIDDTTLQITELPIGSWTEDYKEFLESLILNNQFNLKSFESHYTAKNVNFMLYFTPGSRTVHSNTSKFENNFKLVSTKNLSINNIHLYSEKGSIKKYNNTSVIIKEWSKIRINKYYLRKNHQVKNLENDYNILSSKIRFILDVIAGNIKIMNVKLDVIANKLVELKYPKIYKDSDNTTDDNESDLIKGYNYLIKMPISQLTLDRKLILEKEVEDLKNKLDLLKNISINKIWKDELEILKNKWIEHRDYILNDYLNDKNNVSTTKATKKKKK